MIQPGEIFVIGINHLYASVAIRERIDPEKIAQVISAYESSDVFNEWVVLATCNRTELYVISADSHEAEKIVVSLFPEKNYTFQKLISGF